MSVEDELIKLTANNEIQAKQTKTDKAWEEIFEKLPIINTVERGGLYEITASEIKKYGKREPRLMAKFDHRSQLPQLFRKNSLGILPVTRGSYVIGKFNAYANLDIDSEVIPQKVSFPEDVVSIPKENITSESISLNAAFMSGMIDKVLDVNHKDTILTLSGRMSSGDLQFRIKTKKNTYQEVKVNNSQMEIDGGFETSDAIAIIEAKQHIPNDFLVRQLFYPYYYANKQFSSKTIRPFFFTYSDNIFSFHEYIFEEPNVYSSIKKINQKDFIFAGVNEITLDDLIDVYRNTKVVEEPKNEKNKFIPFPQADSFVRVIDLLKFISSEPRSREVITLYYGFTPRQTQYYLTALNYLSLSGKNSDLFSSNALGRKIISEKNYKDRALMLAGCILQYRVFNETFRKFLELNVRPERELACKLIDKYTSIEAEETKRRRASTVVSWINWIINLQS